MLIIPLPGKFSSHKLPIVTIIIVLLNIAVYFTVQWDDRKYYEKAQNIYLQNGLADIELDYYLSYRYKDEKPVLSNSAIRYDREKQKYLALMLKDRRFQSQLTENSIIRPDDPVFERWRELRDQYDMAVRKATAWKYGFIPREHQPFSLISHMFLHGSWEHLLGNMIFLWFVGCVLELGLGRFTYTVLYILGGVFAVGLFYVFNMKSDVPLIGASGAIAGLMGAYTVAYGKTKINVFYSLGFYFNYTRVYAIALLPLWLGYEVLKLIFMKESHVAYLAHIGGLASGAALGYAGIKLFRKDEHQIFEEDPKEKIKPLLEEALQKMETLDMVSARQLLLDVLKLDPSHEEAQKHLYHVDKLHPEKTEFHQSAARWLSFLSRSQGAEQVLTAAFEDYYRHAGKPQLHADLLINISDAFARIGQMDKAEALISYVCTAAPNHPKLSARLMDMAKTCHRQGRYDLRDRLAKRIVEYYPGSQEANMLKDGGMTSSVMS